MCTSFLHRGDDTIIAMNYDNHGMSFELAPYNPDRLVVRQRSWGRNRPLFGLRADGVFINQQVVDACPAGVFRVGPKVTHTSALVEKVLSGRLRTDAFGTYLKNRTIVNPPGLSLHVLLANADGNSWIVEPGRGVMEYGKEVGHIVMGNCPVTGCKTNGTPTGFGVDRYLKAREMLRGAGRHFGVHDALEVLRQVQQTEGNWQTEFSLVYSKRESTAYYCLNREFDRMLPYRL
jgi:hypothetical protein